MSHGYLWLVQLRPQLPLLLFASESASAGNGSRPKQWLQELASAHACTLMGAPSCKPCLAHTQGVLFF